MTALPGDVSVLLSVGPQGPKAPSLVLAPTYPKIVKPLPEFTTSEFIDMGRQPPSLEKERKDTDK